MQPVQVYPNIYLGAGRDLTPIFTAKKGITHVINCAFPEDSPEWFRRQHSDKYVGINAMDRTDVKILAWYPMFEDAMRDFLRTGGTVFVHCQMGINRSAFLLLYFMHKNFGLDFKTLVDRVRVHRPICSNPAFMKEIVDSIYLNSSKSN